MLQRFQWTYETASIRSHQTVFITADVSTRKLYANLSGVDAGREYHSYVNLQVRRTVVKNSPHRTVPSTIPLFLKLQYVSVFRNTNCTGN